MILQVVRESNGDDLGSRTVDDACALPVIMPLLLVWDGQ